MSDVMMKRDVNGREVTPAPQVYRLEYATTGSLWKRRGGWARLQESYTMARSATEAMEQLLKIRPNLLCIVSVERVLGEVDWLETGNVPGSADASAAAAAEATDKPPRLFGHVGNNHAVEVATDEEGNLLWVQRWSLKRMHAAGEHFIQNSCEYEVKFSGMTEGHRGTVLIEHVCRVIGTRPAVDPHTAGRED